MTAQAARAVRGRLRDGLHAVDDRAARLGLVLWQAAKDLLVDNGPQWAAAVSYYALLSAFPLLLLAAALAAN